MAQLKEKIQKELDFIKRYNVGIVGVTGLVGSTLLKLIDEYNFPLNKLKLFASNKSF